MVDPWYATYHFRRIATAQILRCPCPVEVDLLLDLDDYFDTPDLIEL